VQPAAVTSPPLHGQGWNSALQTIKVFGVFVSQSKSRREEGGEKRGEWRYSRKTFETQAAGAVGMHACCPTYSCRCVIAFRLLFPLRGLARWPRPRTLSFFFPLSLASALSQSPSPSFSSVSLSFSSSLPLSSSLPQAASLPGRRRRRRRRRKVNSRLTQEEGGRKEGGRKVYSELKQ
jgi:hypothetical protein